MKKLDHTLLAWFLLVGSVIFVSQGWLRLEPTWRIVSLSALYLASFLLIVQYSLAFLCDVQETRIGADKNPSRLGPIDLQTILAENPSFIRKLFLMAILAIAYTVATASACFHMTTVNELYSYISGWAVFCLIVDTQLRIHHLTRIVEKLSAPAPSVPITPEPRLHVAKQK